MFGTRGLVGTLGAIACLSAWRRTVWAVLCQGGRVQEGHSPCHRQGFSRPAPSSRVSWASPESRLYGTRAPTQASCEGAWGLSDAHPHETQTAHSEARSPEVPSHTHRNNLNLGTGARQSWTREISHRRQFKGKKYYAETWFPKAE